MAGNLIHITNAGRAALVSGDSTGTREHRVTQIGIGTEPFAFDPDLKAMPGERKRVDTIGGLNVAPDTLHVTIQDSTPDQYAMYAFCLYLESGVLFAVYVQDVPILEKSPAAQMLLASDIQFTEIDAAKLVFGDTSFLNPPATETQIGIVRLATQTEVDTGSDSSRVLTAKTAAARYAPLVDPKLRGEPEAPTPPLADDSKRLATTAFVLANAVTKAQGLAAGIGADLVVTNVAQGDLDSVIVPGEYYYNGTNANRPSTYGLLKVWRERTSIVYQIAHSSDNALYARRLAGGVWMPWRRFAGTDSPAFTGTPTTPSPAAFDNSSAVASTAWVQANTLAIRRALGDAVDVDTVVTSGIYHQPSNAWAGSGQNYPRAVAGKLEVFASDVMVYQWYHEFQSAGIWYRSRYAGVWNAWRKVAEVNSPTFTGVPTAPTAAPGTNNLQIASTAFVQTAVREAIRDEQIGQIVFEPRTMPRAGYLKCNGAVLWRTDYPALWLYAGRSGALVSDAEWANGASGGFSTGNDVTTFRIPDLRGEFVRGWDDARGLDSGRRIGWAQNGQNLSHDHAASSAAVGDHAHTAWTDAQGWHGHAVYDPGHAHAISTWSGDGGGTGDGRISGSYIRSQSTNGGTHAVGTGIDIHGNGTHGHNIGIGAAGAHAHTINVAASGGDETRPRNVALLALIRAF